MLTAFIPAYFLDAGLKEKIFFLLFPMLILISSFFVFINTKVSEQNISLGFSFLIVTLSWFVMAVLGAIPFVFISGLPFVDAFFETMSGLTTTGASILTNIEALPYSLLYWRSLTNWLGGMGIIVLFLAIFPFFNFGSSIYKAEVPGPNSDKLTSRITQTAKILWLVYILLTFILFLFLKLCGMNFIDAICHAFTTMATGGFSTKNASIGHFNHTIQFVTTIFMFIAGCNFIWHVKLLRGKPFNYFKREEFLFFLFITILATILISFNLYQQANHSENLFHILNKSSFQVVSLITTTGFASTDFNLWPNLAKFILFFLCFIGACGGSTSGGMKLSRIIIIIKKSLLQIKSSIKPLYSFPILFNKKNIKETEISKLFSFIFLYLLTFVLGVIIILLLNSNCSFTTALSTSIACLSNIGPGLDQIGPIQNYSWFNTETKYFLSFLMLVGRLEIYTVLALFSRSLWSK